MKTLKVFAVVSRNEMKHIKGGGKQIARPMCGLILCNGPGACGSSNCFCKAAGEFDYFCVERWPG